MIAAAPTIATAMGLRPWRMPGSTKGRRTRMLAPIPTSAATPRHFPSETTTTAKRTASTISGRERSKSTKKYSPPGAAVERATMIRSPSRMGRAALLAAKLNSTRRPSGTPASRRAVTSKHENAGPCATSTQSTDRTIETTASARPVNCGALASGTVASGQGRKRPTRSKRSQFNTSESWSSS